MEASVRSLNSSLIKNKMKPLILIKKTSPNFPPLLPPRFPRHTTTTKPYCSHRIPSNSSPNNSPLFSNHFSTTSNNCFFSRISSSPSETSPPFHWNYPTLNTNAATNANRQEPVVTVVLLGWLGSKRKHLRRYADLYNARGFNALTFVAPVNLMVSLDLGRAFQLRISQLAAELGSWLSHKDKDGRDRLLMFHTFSNTGWLAYGAILNDLQGRPDLLDKIKGCVFDSGGDPDINPKVWAAGFAAALLKKRSSAIYPGEGNGVENEMTVSSMGGKEPLLIEVFLLLLLEKLFSFLLNLPDINQRLTKIISGLSENQPPCPQLYLYSTADKVIPYQSVESFIEAQKGMGRKVCSYNFGSSPHVDHYRTFPTIYSSQVHNFLEECFAMAKRK